MMRRVTKNRFSKIFLLALLPIMLASAPINNPYRPTDEDGGKSVFYS